MFTKVGGKIFTQFDERSFQTGCSFLGGNQDNLWKGHLPDALDAIKRVVVLRPCGRTRFSLCFFVPWKRLNYIYIGVSKNRGTHKSSILIGFSIVNHPFWGTPMFGNTHMAHISKFTIGPDHTHPRPHVPHHHQESRPKGQCCVATQLLHLRCREKDLWKRCFCFTNSAHEIPKSPLGCCLSLFFWLIEISKFYLYMSIIYILRRQTVHAFFGIPQKWSGRFTIGISTQHFDGKWTHVDCIPIYPP